MSIVYAIAIVLSATGIAVLDRRFHLAFGRAPRRTAVLLGIGVAFFLAWDAVGIALGVFRHLDSRWATGIMVAPQLPLEEVMFVTFLTYLTLVLLGAWRQIDHRKDGA
ncbi:lycopene cyclase domain-containing protein [Microbacterium karelineae]|uniref:lycopene cyclase domain-containing protein n=1 Tax=Microbacterium karelineae TaxID=2654283 RepID=UPI0012EA475B|nr:lycopene cyclase domain-containing protein [Microbacterium karelineae]